MRFARHQSQARATWLRFARGAAVAVSVLRDPVELVEKVVNMVLIELLIPDRGFRSSAGV